MTDAKVEFSVDQLRSLQEQLGTLLADRPSATIRELMPDVRAACPPKSKGTYKRGFDRLVEHMGDRTPGEVNAAQLRAVRDLVKAEVGEAQVAVRARHSSDADAYGHGAAEHFVRATRFFFKYVGHPEAIVDFGPTQRPDGPERALDEHELEDLVHVCTVGSGAPELDGLLFDFFRHTACRREGTLNLRRMDLNEAKGQVTLTEKLGKTRVMPLQRSLIRAILRHGEGRGAVSPSDKAFRYKNGNALTRRRFNTMFDALDDYSDWSEAMDVGPHWIRHTTLTDVANAFGDRIAEAYAGHTESRKTIKRYTLVTFEQLVDAYETLFGGR